MEDAASSKETISQVSFPDIIPRSKTCGPMNPLSVLSQQSNVTRHFRNKDKILAQKCVN